MNDRDAKVLLMEDRYPDGANCPTRHIEYECPCKKGRIIHERVPGFDDYWTVIKCRRCKKIYEIESGYGYIWELVEKE